MAEFYEQVQRDRLACRPSPKSLKRRPADEYTWTPEEERVIVLIFSRLSTPQYRRRALIDAGLDLFPYEVYHSKYLTMGININIKKTGAFCDAEIDATVAIFDNRPNITDRMKALRLLGYGTRPYNEYEKRYREEKRRRNPPKPNPTKRHKSTSPTVKRAAAVASFVLNQ